MKSDELLTPSYRLGYDEGYYDAMCERTGTKPSRRHQNDMENKDEDEFNRGYKIGKEEGIKFFSK